MTEILWVGYPRSYTPGRTRPPQVVVWHYTAGTEGPVSAEAGARYNKVRLDGTSCHYHTDSFGPALQEVPDGDRAHTARRRGNEIGIQIEICGTVQTRDQWLDPTSYATLQTTAGLTAILLRRHGLAFRRLSVAELRAAYYEDRSITGIVDHATCTLAFPEDNGSHMDVGAGFPWDVAMAMVAAALEEDDMTPEQERLLRNAETYAWKETVGEAQVTGILGADGKPVPPFTNVPHKQRVDTLAKLDELLARPAATPPPADLAAQIAALLAADEAFLTAIAATVADVQAERLQS